MAKKTLTPAQIGTILITGCSSGIGRALCNAFATRGYFVLATARKRSDIEALAGPNVSLAELDVTDPASIARLDLAGRSIGMLVNNAGFGLMGPMLDLDIAAFRRQYETNVVALLAMTQACAPAMVARKRGRIVNISSVSGVLTTPLAGAYCSSKAAVNAMSDAMRMELAPLGIDVITVQPGAITSSFGETATATLKKTFSNPSLYAPIADVVERRAIAGQIGAMPTPIFASTVADALLCAKVKTLIRVGPHSRRLPLMRRWIPTAMLDRLLSKRFQLGRLDKP